MKYRTNNELDHFKYEEAHISKLSLNAGSFLAILDGVTILESNSCNRDIRNMRTNDLHLRFPNGTVSLVVEEGYKVYDADGNLDSTHSDTIIAPEKYAEALKKLTDCTVYDITKADGVYTLDIDTFDHTWKIQITGDSDVEEWDRFINPDAM